MIEGTEHNFTESEISPFQEICPRHGAKMNRRHGCAKCVMEEVRRHESRIHASLDVELELELDAPIPANALGNANPLSAEIR
jgi:hypothetical protein